MKYTHLTQDERYQIGILAKAGHHKSEIARLMERHKSTINREMTPSRGARGYRSKQAHARSQARTCAAQNSPRVAAGAWAIVHPKLAETWSPEQISGTLREVATSHLKVNRQATVSHEAIYYTSMPTSAPGARCIARCAADSRAGHVMAVANDAVRSPIRCPSICAQLSWLNGAASATGKAIW